MAQTLYDLLRLNAPEVFNDAAVGVDGADDAYEDPKSVAEFAKSVLNSKSYRASLARRIVTDTLPVQVELRLYDYAHGKPVERMEVKDTTVAVSEMSYEQLEERALQLAARAHELRMNGDGVNRSSDEDAPPTTLH